MEPGRPALGPAHEREHLFRRQLDPGLVHEPGGLGPGHRELLGRELERTALGTHAPHRQRGVTAAREHELGTREEGLPDCDHRLSSGGCVHGVHIVEGQDAGKLSCAQGPGKALERHRSGVGPL